MRASTSYGVAPHETSASAVSSNLSITLIAICAFLAGICISFVSYQLMFLVGAYIVAQTLIKSAKKLTILNPSTLPGYYLSRNYFSRSRESTKNRRREYKARRACKRLSYALCKTQIAPLISYYTANNNSLILIHKYLSDILYNVLRYLNRNPLNTYTSVIYHVSCFLNDTCSTMVTETSGASKRRWNTQCSNFEKYLKILLIDAESTVIKNEDLEMYQALNVGQIGQPLNELLAPVLSRLIFSLCGGEPDWSDIYPTVSSADTYDVEPEDIESTVSNPPQMAQQEQASTMFQVGSKMDDVVDRFFSETEFDPNLAVDSLLYLNDDFRKFCANTRHKDKIEFINLFHLFRKERDNHRGHVTVTQRIKQEQELLQLEERFPALRNEMLSSEINIQEYRGRGIYSKLVWLESKISQQLVKDVLDLYRWNCKIWKVDVTSEEGPKIAPFKPQQPKYFERNVRSLWAPKWYLERECQDWSVDSEGDMLNGSPKLPKRHLGDQKLELHRDSMAPDSEDQFETSSNVHSVSFSRRGTGTRILAERKVKSLDRTLGLKSSKDSSPQSSGADLNPNIDTQSTGSHTYSNYMYKSTATSIRNNSMFPNLDIPVMTDWKIIILKATFTAEDESFNTFRHLTLELEITDTNENTWRKTRQIAKFYELESALVKFHRKDPRRVILPPKSKVNSLFWTAYLFKSRRESLVKDFEGKYAPELLNFIRYWLKVPTAKQSELIFKFLGGDHNALSTFHSEAGNGSVYRNATGTLTNMLNSITVPKSQHLDIFMVSFVANCHIEEDEKNTVTAKDSYFTCFDENKNRISSSTVPRSLRHTDCEEDPAFTSLPGFGEDGCDDNYANQTNDLIDLKEIDELSVSVTEREPTVLGLYDSVHLAVLGALRFIIKQEFDFHWVINSSIEACIDGFFSTILAIFLLAIPRSWWNKLYRKIDEEIITQLESLTDTMLDEGTLLAQHSSLIPDFETTSIDSAGPESTVDTSTDYATGNTAFSGYISTIKDHIAKCFTLDAECNLALVSRVLFIIIPRSSHCRKTR